MKKDLASLEKMDRELSGKR